MSGSEDPLDELIGDTEQPCPEEGREGGRKGASPLPGRTEGAQNPGCQKGGSPTQTVSTRPLGARYSGCHPQELLDCQGLVNLERPPPARGRRGRGAFKGTVLTLVRPPAELPFNLVHC